MRQLTKEEAKDIDIDFIYNHRQAVFIGDKVEMCICGHDLYHHLPESSNGCWMKGCKCQFCKDCIEIELGLYPYDEHYKDWLVKKGDICEGCGHDLYHHLPESSNGCWMKGCKCQFYRSMFSKDKQGVMK